MLTDTIQFSSGYEEATLQPAEACYGITRTAAVGADMQAAFDPTLYVVQCPPDRRVTSLAITTEDTPAMRVTCKRLQSNFESVSIIGDIITKDYGPEATSLAGFSRMIVATQSLNSLEVLVPKVWYFSNGFTFYPYAAQGGAASPFKLGRDVSAEDEASGAWKLTPAECPAAKSLWASMARPYWTIRAEDVLRSEQSV
jgi:hypothetical protein